MKYRTESNALLVTSAWDREEESDVVVHVRCAAANPVIEPNGLDYAVENGECCAVCGEDLF